VSLIGDLIGGLADGEEPEPGRLADWLEDAYESLAEKFPERREELEAGRARAREMAAIEDPVERRRDALRRKMERRAVRKPVARPGDCPRCGNTGWLIEFQIPPGAQGEILYGYDVAVACSCRGVGPKDRREPTPGRTRRTGAKRKSYKDWKQAASGERPEGEEDEMKEANRIYEERKAEREPGED
jgi:hypothetical protein